MSNFDWLESIISERTPGEVYPANSDDLDLAQERFFTAMNTLADKIMDVIKAAEAVIDEYPTHHDYIPSMELLDEALAYLKEAKDNL